MSLKEACMDIIAELKPDDGIAYLQAVAEVENRTGLTSLGLRGVQSAMREASEQLIANGVSGVRNARRYGWVRMTDSTVLRHAGERVIRGRRQMVRGGRAAKVADPENLSWEDRQRRDEILRKSTAMTELMARRSSKKRPPEVESPS
jgi:hypothetical protein